MADSIQLQAARDCDLCEGHENINWRCLTCPAYMCEKCYGLHRSRKNFRKHDIISIELFKKQNELGLEMTRIGKCPAHPQNEITLDCTTCGVLVCHVCVAKMHNGHMFDDLQSTIGKSKEKLSSCLEKLQHKQIYAQDQIGNSSKELDSVEMKAKETKEEIIKSRDARVALIIAESDKLIEQVDSRMKENQSSVSNANSKLQAVQKDIEVIAKDAQNKMDSTNFFVINYLLNEARKIDDVDLRSNTSLSVPTFHDEITDASKRLGTLQFDVFEVSEYPNSSPPLADFTESSIVHTRVIASEIRAVSPSQIWYSYFNEEHLQYLDYREERASSLSLNFKVKGFVIDKHGNFIVCDVDAHRLMHVTPEGNVSILCSTHPQKPWGICLNHRQQPVVCMDKSLVVYAPDCQTKLQEFSRDQYGNPLFTWSYRVAPNGVSDYCVADTDGCKVVTIDMEGTLKWTYSGGKTRNKFKPWNICCDKHMYVFVADTDNNKVHVLDKFGKFITYITDILLIEQPRGLAATYDGTLWIGEENDSRKLHMVKYLKDPWDI
ncbi:hypothetical protein FSP39_019610 [Pinctada imbricata]|uniref:B box-type domain-containing protein n=1 Tax=Pinctada imbricata TaxID=66713 RepID=A0AA88XDM7_PINIB|nr:hypothetical protein FSP39_019610 [Pinctada imbricata]